jgi:CheY-like chemotaxis protein
VLVHDGEEALRQLRASLPALVILDVVLPDLDGIALAKHLKADPMTEAIPIIAVTGMREGCAEAVEAGCLACLDKPFDLDELTDLVRRSLVPKERSVSEGTPASS